MENKKKSDIVFWSLGWERVKGTEIQGIAVHHRAPNFEELICPAVFFGQRQWTLHTAPYDMVCVR